jgi:hypothetical protein
MRRTSNRKVTVFYNFGIDTPKSCHIQFIGSKLSDPSPLTRKEFTQGMRRWESLGAISKAVYPDHLKYFLRTE